MKFDDVVAIIGPQNEATDLAEKMCMSLGIRFFYVMKNGSPAERIKAMGEEPVIEESFSSIPENVFCLGLMCPQALLDSEILDCNFNTERDMISHLLGWFVYRIPTEADLPEGWALLPGSVDSLSKDYVPGLECQRKGSILSGGRVVVNFGQENRLLQMPADYQHLFPLIEGSGV